MDAQTNKLRTNNTSWCSFTVTSSNAVMADALSTFRSAVDGELKRVIDLHISIPPGVPKAESDEVFAPLADNYGLAGPVFMQYVMNHRDWVENMLQKMQAKVDAEMGLVRGDRFYSAVLAVAFTAALIGRRIGLHSIDMERVYQYAIATVGSIKQANSTTVGNTEVLAQETLAKFINENVNNTLIINGNKGADIAAPVQMPRGELRMRYEPDTGELVIVAQDLRKYFVERRVDFRSSLHALKASGVLKVPAKGSEWTVVRRPAAGAIGNMAGSPTRCYVFDGAKLGVMNAINAENGTAAS
jgi:hypothetical protein